MGGAVWKNLSSISDYQLDSSSPIWLSDSDANQNLISDYLIWLKKKFLRFYIFKSFSNIEKGILKISRWN